MKKLFVVLFFLASCKSHKPSAPHVEPFQDVIQKASLYCELSKPIYDELKYVSSECDGAGFTSLYAIACPQNDVDLSVFEGVDGMMYRSPDKDCFPHKSKAEYSKDHVLMRLAAAVEQKDNLWPRRFLQHVENGNGFFCAAVDEVTKISRCLISPNLVVKLRKAAGIFPLAVDQVGYSDDALFERKSFETHLHVVNIWMTGRLYGSISATDLSYLEIYAKREPLNGLYQSVAYRYGLVSQEQVLTAFNTKHWPADRLPTTNEHCTHYLFQRDMTTRENWDPCPEKQETHHGVDYVFAAYVLTQ